MPTRHTALELPRTCDRHELSRRFRRVREASEQICRPLAIEDHVIQSMEDVSPPKWHLAHTTWFFECFVLDGRERGYRPFDPTFAHLFNSYYETVGEPYPRSRRGLLSRPTVREVLDYRRAVDERVLALLAAIDDETLGEVAPIVELGTHHEEQHQELLFMDIKHILYTNPLRPAYRDGEGTAGRAALRPASWESFPGGIVEVGADGSEFAFDNELPRHRALLEPYRLATRPVSNGEFTGFIADGGYERPELWLADGWATVRREGWQAPLYWEPADDTGGSAWRVMTLRGMQAVDLAEPVCHVSLYEADAFATWAGARLPTEQEWEHALDGGDGDTGRVWEWTASPYAPYPGFVPWHGSLGEYNGKFMSGQNVLRGGSAATPSGHARATYRNFFAPGSRWQFSGLRLAKGA